MHKWKFFRVCGLDQVMLRNGADIAHLSELDQKLWTVLSCPTKGVRFDQKTLELLDTDRDGRIRVPEILAAIERKLELRRQHPGQFDNRTLAVM